MLEVCEMGMGRDNTKHPKAADNDIRYVREIIILVDLHCIHLDHHSFCSTSKQVGILSVVCDDSVCEQSNCCFGCHHYSEFRRAWTV